jgi:hypothetical protein
MITCNIGYKQRTCDGFLQADGSIILRPVTLASQLTYKSLRITMPLIMLYAMHDETLHTCITNTKDKKTYSWKNLSQMTIRWAVHFARKQKLVWRYYNLLQLFNLITYIDFKNWRTDTNKNVFSRMPTYAVKYLKAGKLAWNQDKMIVRLRVFRLSNISLYFSLLYNSRWNISKSN